MAHIYLLRYSFMRDRNADYKENSILGVFSTKDTAKDAMKKFAEMVEKKGYHRQHFFIDKYKIDELVK